MSKPPPHSLIRLRGVRHNNLKGFDLDLPLRQLIVVTGLSGSGKSSLAFDTLFAEGQRRYIETFSPYARQFFDRMDKPRVDSIEGIPPAIAIEQRNAVKSTRSTVGTMTEICDYLKLLWPQVARLHCRQCRQPVRKDSPQQIWEKVNSESRIQNPESQTASEVYITFDLPLSEKISLEESLNLISKQGYQRILLGGEIVRVEEVASRIQNPESRIQNITVIQDRVKLAAANRARFVEACEQAYHFGKGRLSIHELASVNDAPRPQTPNPRPFSSRLHCAACDLEYREPTPALFSFNHPLGACPTCRGFGRTITIDYDLAIPDRTKTLAEGAVKPWQTGHGLESQQDLLTFCKKRKVPTKVPFAQLPETIQQWVIDGDPSYNHDDPAHSWPRAWYGVKGYFRWLESKSYKMHVRVLLSRYRAYQTCPACHGKRFQPEALLYKLPWSAKRVISGPVISESVTSNQSETSPAALLNTDLLITGSLITGSLITDCSLADFYALSIRDALRVIESLRAVHSAIPNDPLRLVLDEVRARLGYLAEVGLDYLTLDRPTRTLSGGETERVNLTTCLGTRLVNTLYVLDEPSVGLHPRDTARLVGILQRLRDTGNTVVVVEHEASVMRAADQIVDLGPGHGEAGGRVVFQGAYSAILKSSASLTGQYLSGRQRIEIPRRRAVESGAAGKLVLSHATRHNLKDVTVAIPLGCFVCLTGVSGSGKTTMVRDVLLPLLEARLKSSTATPAIEESVPASDEANEADAVTRDHRSSAMLSGWESLGRVVLVDQSALGKTPRSNPAVYIGAFDDIREVFARSEPARQRGLNASAFSFNSAQGQCERCRGAGFEKIEMQFLSDVFIRCPDCDGRRYRAHILEVKLVGKVTSGSVISNQSAALRASKRRRNTDSLVTDLLITDSLLSIADLLDATVDEAIVFLASFTDSKPARRAVESLKLLQEVGLGYLRLGQPINTLSGGESQRLKLVSHLAEAAVEHRESKVETGKSNTRSSSRPSTFDLRSTLFLFDEPTTGLHFEDVRVLLKVFQRLVDAGHSVIVIEHNLDVIKCADWLIDLGPEAGDQGGQIVAQGPPEAIAACPHSHTGRALREWLHFQDRAAERTVNQEH